MEDLRFDFQLTSAQADDAAAPAAAGWCVRCPKHRKKFCGGLYFSVATGHAYVKGPAEKFKNSWRLGVWAVAEKDGFIYRSLHPSNHVQKSAPPTMKSRPSDHMPWRIVNRVDCSADSYVLELQRETSSAVSGGFSGFLRNLVTVHLTPQPADQPNFSCFHVDIGVETDDNRYVARPYTPLSSEEDFNTGTMRLIVKTYAQGKFTPLLAAKAVGSTIFSSPVEPTVALPATCSSFVGVFGGTGISPIYALTREFLRAKRPVTLLAFNHTPQDFLGDEQLQQLQRELDSESILMRCKHFFTGDCPSNRIDTQKVLAHAPVAPGAAVVVCGPTGFLEASRIALHDAGYHSRDIHLLDA